jgi:formylglycine-generating enzyme required for sulfatase activity
MKEEKKITQADIDGAKVQLAPLAGIPVRVYLPLAYGLALLLALFLLLLLPGINKYGSYLEFKGQPGPSAVFSGDDYKGNSAQSIFFPAGSYTLRIEHEGFASQDLEVKVSGRLFGSLLFPRKQVVAFGLSTRDAAAYLQTSYSEFSAWSLSGKPSALYQLPTVMSAAVSDLALTGALKAREDPAAFRNVTSGEKSRGGLPSDRDFARDLASASSSAESARDGLRASIIYSSSGVLSPLSLAYSARTLLSALGNSRGFANYLQDLVPGLAADVAAAGSAEAASGSAEAAAGTGGASPGTAGLAAPSPLGRKSIAGQEFVLFSKGTITLGGEAPSGSRVSYLKDSLPFGLAVAEVSNRQWARFMDQNPDWSLERKASLLERGLVDEGYLAGWKGADDLPVTGVSWFAAQAYCEWLSSLSGAYRFGLPSEAMWEAAARSGLADGKSEGKPAGVWSDGRRGGPDRAGSAGLDKSGIADLFGNVWEWSADSYRPYPAFAADRLQSSERSVRGGSWANKPGTIGLYSRGGFEPARCSPYLGFRLALLNP